MSVVNRASEISMDFPESSRERESWREGEDKKVFIMDNQWEQLYYLKFFYFHLFFDADKSIIFNQISC